MYVDESGQLMHYKAHSHDIFVNTGLATINGANVGYQSLIYCLIDHLYTVY